jgi:hypothetical protein
MAAELQATTRRQHLLTMSRGFPFSNGKNLQPTWTLYGSDARDSMSKLSLSHSARHLLHTTLFGSLIILLAFLLLNCRRSTPNKSCYVSARQSSH